MVEGMKTCGYVHRDWEFSRVSAGVCGAVESVHGEFTKGYYQLWGWDSERKISSGVSMVHCELFGVSGDLSSWTTEVRRVSWLGRQGWKDFGTLGKIGDSGRSWESLADDNVLSARMLDWVARDGCGCF
ncbi:hypothetical protein Tco_0149528 [Tanacetum coccineum]